MVVRVKPWRPKHGKRQVAEGVCAGSVSSSTERSQNACSYTRVRWRRTWAIASRRGLIRFLLSQRAKGGERERGEVRKHFFLRKFSSVLRRFFNQKERTGRKPSKSPSFLEEGFGTLTPSMLIPFVFPQVILLNFRSFLIPRN